MTLIFSTIFLLNHLALRVLTARKRNVLKKYYGLLRFPEIYQRAAGGLGDLSPNPPLTNAKSLVFTLGSREPVFDSEVSAATSRKQPLDGLVLSIRQ